MDTLRLLLDTATFPWIVAGAPRPPGARPGGVRRSGQRGLPERGVHPGDRPEARARPAPLPEPVERFVPSQRRRPGIEPFALDEESTLQLARLPRLHRDPLDRMLVCQSIAHGLVILNPDPAIAQYPVRVMW